MRDQAATVSAASGAAVDRHPHSDARPGARPGVNLERAAHGLQAFGHADQAEAPAPRRIDVEPDAVVDDGQGERRRDRRRDANRDVAGPLYLSAFCSASCTTPEQAQRQIGRQGRRERCRA